MKFEPRRVICLINSFLYIWFPVASFTILTSKRLGKPRGCFQSVKDTLKKSKQTNKNKTETLIPILRFCINQSLSLTQQGRFKLWSPLPHKQRWPWASRRGGNVKGHLASSIGFNRFKDQGRWTGAPVHRRDFTQQKTVWTFRFQTLSTSKPHKMCDIKRTTGVGVKALALVWV